MSNHVSKKRILVIDDEDDIREVAQLSLEMVGGWEVVVARSGQDGLALALKEQPDAILLDVMMPDMDGPATFSHLKANPDTQKIPVILLTAKVLSAEQNQLSDLGVTGIIAKPFDPMSLANQVAHALGWGF